MVHGSLSLPEPGKVSLKEKEKKYLDLITGEQLGDRALWSRFVSVFFTKEDSDDRGWRGEYWGKAMRGACLTYRCTADGELYDILLDSVRQLIACAEEDGRISSYRRENECSGWDVWCRKYVLTGMLHFVDICRDGELREELLDAMEKHVDRLMEKVGDGAGKIPVTETSDFWLGVNSCSILESVLDLYKRRRKKRFLDFAEYIISTGGCAGGDLIALALEDKTPPYLYPENKAYETMSFFEGVLAYYEVTGKRKYLDAVLRFAEKTFETEITLIGCAGCAHEQFDNAAARQCEKRDTLMQETCVTVTWMRLCARLFLLTGEEKYARRVEISALNALYGSVNVDAYPITMEKTGEKIPGLPFDSYSPLFYGRRGLGVGGLKYFSDGAFYGCCAAIGAAGLALYPLIRSLMRMSDGDYTLEEHRLGGKTAFTYGPYALARDEAKEDGDILAPVKPAYESGRPVYELMTPHSGESVRLLLKTKQGEVLLTDYASCGREPESERDRLTVWMPAE